MSMSAPFYENSEVVATLLWKAIAAFPESWDAGDVRYVEFHKTMTAMYAQNAETLIVALDPRYADATVREKIEADTTMAEEPRESAERRQWLNGYMMGFREGFERAGWLGRTVTGE